MTLDKVHYHTYKPPLDPIPNSINPVHMVPYLQDNLTLYQPCLHFQMVSCPLVFQTKLFMGF